MHKSAMKCNKTLGKWCKNKHGASKIMDTLETYHLLAAFSHVLVQKMASLCGLVQEGPTLIEARLISGGSLGDPASEGAGHGRQHPQPCVVGVGLRSDPRGPPQYLWQRR
jgi:hypothetical protein